MRDQFGDLVGKGFEGDVLVRNRLDEFAPHLSDSRKRLPEPLQSGLAESISEYYADLAYIQSRFAGIPVRAGDSDH